MKKVYLFLSGLALWLNPVAAADAVTLDLSRPVNPATFETDSAKGHWTETYSEEYPFIEFEGGFAFSHLINKDSYGGYAWNGFTYATSGDNADYAPEGGSSSNWVANQWGCMAGGGIKTDETGQVVIGEDGKPEVQKGTPYLIGFWRFYGEETGERTLQTLFTADGFWKPQGMYVNFHPWPYYGVQHGDGFARPFNQEGDCFKLIIHGLDANLEDNGKTVEHIFAEYKDGTLHQSPDWEWVDLSSLGAVGGLYYTFETTDADPLYGPNTAVYFCMDKLSYTAVDTYSIAVPEGANLFVGKKGGAHFVPFTEIEPLGSSTADGKTTHTFEYTGGQFNYRVSQPGKVTYASIFTPKSGEAIEITADMLAGDPKQLDRDPASNSGSNVADIFLNINEKGYLKLDKASEYQIVNIRNWQTIDGYAANYFIEPDYHYTVVNENGVADNSVVSVDETGLLTAHEEGTAIVLVTYDAINVPSSGYGPFFGALWPENTGVFVVSVGAPESGIVPNMKQNAALNAENLEHRLAGEAVDAELDVFYYVKGTDGHHYTFTPEGVTEVLLARPTLSDAGLSYTGFSTEGVTANADGSYTLCLTEGRNIVKLVSATGAEYQVMSAKPVEYTVTNNTTPGDVYMPGDEVSIRFHTLYHPTNKLAGVYNMYANIQYSDGTSLYSGKRNQYAFASTEAAQTVTATIPADWAVGTDFVLSQGALKSSAWGDPFGGHRSITYEVGKNPNFNAVMHTAYFGSLPVISLPVGQTTTGINSTKLSVSAWPNPFTDYLVVRTEAAQRATLYDLAGKAVLTTKLQSGDNRIDTSTLPHGTYVLRCNGAMAKVVK